MNAIQFIKDHGVEKAREVVEGAPEWAIFWISRNQYHGSVITFPNMTDHYSVDLVDLNRLVESITIVKDHGGLETIKKCVEKTIFPLSDRIIRMKQAIADYEAIGGEHV